MDFKHPPQGMIDLRPIKKKTNNPAPNGILADFFSYKVFSGDQVILDLNKANTTKSFITFNAKDIKRLDDYQVYYVYSNTPFKWRMKLTKGVYDGKLNFFKPKHSIGPGHAVIAVASPYIEMPYGDLQYILNKMYKSDRTIRQNKVNGLWRSSRTCEKAVFRPITFTFGNYKFEIPPEYWTREIDYNCHLLIKTTNGNIDEGYVLGTPFLQAFKVVLDYQKNKMGFAMKNNSSILASITKK